MIFNDSRNDLIDFIRQRMNQLNEAVQVWDGQIDRQHIRDLAVDTAKIEDLAVITAKIVDLAVTTAKIANLAVTTGKIDNLAVTVAKIADLAVETAKIDDLAVTTAKIDELAVTEAKIDDLAVTDAKIADLSADKITAGVLNAATIFLTGVLMALADPDSDPSTQQRVVIDQNGISLFGANGDQIVKIPVSGDPYFHAHLEALGLTVLGDFSLRGTTNAIEPGATVTLKEAITAPATAPALSSFWDTLEIDASSLIDQLNNAAAVEVIRRGLNYTASGGQGGSTPSFYTTVLIRNADSTHETWACEINASTGVLTRSVKLGSNFNSSAQPGGAVRIGGNLWVLAFDNTGGTGWKFIRYNATASATTFTSPTEFAWSEVERGQGYPAMASDGTDIYIVDRVDGALPGAYQIHRYNTTPTRLSLIETDYTPETTSHGATGLYVGNGDFGAARRLISETDLAGNLKPVRSFNASGVQQVNEQFPAPATPYGVAYDGTRFWTLRKANPFGVGFITKHSTWKWTTESSKYWARFSFYQDDTTGMVDPGVWAASTNYALGDRRRPTGTWTPGTTHVFEVVVDGGSSGGSEPSWPTTPGATVTDGGLTWVLRDQESTKSPVSAITHLKRSKLRITAVDIPTQASHIGFYLDRGASEPTLDLQQFAAVKTVDIQDFATSPIAPSAASTFPAGTPATFETSDGSPLLTAKGLSRCTLSYSGGHTLNDSTKEYITFGTETQDTHGYHDDSATDALGTTPGTTAEETFPFTGQYLAFIRVTFGASGAGRREIGVETDRTGSFADFETFSFPPASGGGTRIAFPVVIDDVTAGDKMRVYLFQTSGLGLTINNAKLSLFYIGPSE